MEIKLSKTDAMAITYLLPGRVTLRAGWRVDYVLENRTVSDNLSNLNDSNEELVAGYVSQLWANDWDNEDDDIYG